MHSFSGTRFLAVLLIPASIAMAGESPAVYLEHPDDPPAPLVPRDDVLARSAGAQVTSGPYVSIQANVDELGQNIVGDAANEPSITVDPVSPNRIVIGWRQFDAIASNFRQAGWAFSQDAGRSWAFPGVLDPGVFRSDPVLDIDAGGRFFYQSLKASLRLDVYRSDDGGLSWPSSVPSFGGDKNWMAIDRTSGVGDGNVYGIWQRFGACCANRVFTRSVNGGASFDQPHAVPRSPTFGTVAVGPDGDVYAAGIDGSVTQDFDTFVVAHSTTAQDPEANVSFSTSEVDMGGSMAYQAAPNPEGLLGQANVAVDHSDGPSRGHVYLLATVTTDDVISSTDVRIARSVDGGLSWGKPVRVNDDPPQNNAWQWFGALAVAPNGRLDAIWNDTRNSVAANMSQLYYAYSWDGGQSWSPNVPASPAFDTHAGWPNQNKIGDYYTIVSDQSGASVAYSATFNGEQDVYFVRVFPDCNGNGRSDVLDVLEGHSGDCNQNLVPDLCELPLGCAAAGSVSAGEGPLALTRVAGNQLLLTWSPSCNDADSDFAIYEGTLGNFASHLPIGCSTAGRTSSEITAGAGDRYYLVVPSNPTREGSYGLDSDGVERPASTARCKPQAVGPCS